MSITVGIPRALLYYEYAPLWISFFKQLDTTVVLSNKTNKHILNQGTHYSVDDACIPVKLYHGHVIDLKDQVDYLFIPRIMGVSKGDFICPKFCGLPEMIKYSLNDLPKIINTKIDLTKNPHKLKDTIKEIGYYVTSDTKKIIKSYEVASNEYKVYKEKLKKGILPSDSKQVEINFHTSKKPKIMVMGHPYLLYDDYLNMNVIRKLRKEGFEVLTPDMIDEEVLKQYAKKYDGKIFWNFSRKLLGASLYILEHQLIDGIIYMSSFGCGVDSILEETIERRIRRLSNIPFMLMTLDEHSGEAGFNTRLEAFIDMLKWRNEYENYISTYG